MIRENHLQTCHKLMFGCSVSLVSSEFRVFGQLQLFFARQLLFLLIEYLLYAIIEILAYNLVNGKQQSALLESY